MTGDRGLAGAFNSQILRAGLRAANEHSGQGRDIAYYASGKRGVSSLTFRGHDLDGRYTGFTDRPGYANAREIAEDVMAAYVDGDLDQVEIFYNGYISPLTQEVRRETLLPLQHATILEESDEDDGGRHRPPRAGRVRARSGADPPPADSRLRRDLGVTARCSSPRRPSTARA